MTRISMKPNGATTCAEQILDRVRLRTRAGETPSLDLLRAETEAAVSRRAIETGVLDGARTALVITESAYRFGERSVIEYLDAQRSFRAVRNDLIAARHDLQTARIEVERLAGMGFNG